MSRKRSAKEADLEREPVEKPKGKSKSIKEEASEEPPKKKQKIEKTKAVSKGKGKDKDSKSKKKASGKRDADKKDKKDETVVKQVPKTLDNMREFDETFVKADDAEVLADEGADAFAAYYNGKAPKLVVTTSRKPSKKLSEFSHSMAAIFMNSRYVPRRNYTITEIIESCKKDETITDLIIASESKKEFHSLTLVHLPNGPTAFFRLSSVAPLFKMKQGGQTDHNPELIVNNFNTRLGHTVARMIGGLFPHAPEFEGRRVVTIHNQRDYIFFRQHRYIFESDKEVNVQELGPRFTLKLRWIQRGLFDPDHGEYYWKHKQELDTSRRRFHL
eukprot:TRINITY_DN8393_c0_g1_i1.p1 TRINITY_DN8393_c0_g1~~TRINITY_DN8393_c0_g1_i1.p1  ORF type:complete len:346 (+),score=149.59 TRINITY_DN8393_c0_g1_i1:51-1040(+)